MEGWDAVGSFGGARISDVLKLVGANTSARYLEVQSADDYYESIDMGFRPASAVAQEAVTATKKPLSDFP